MEQQFALTYYTSMSYSDVGEMTPFELETLISKLKRVKELEQEKLTEVGEK